MQFEEVFAGILNLNGDYSAKNIALTLIEFLLNVVLDDGNQHPMRSSCKKWCHIQCIKSASKRLLTKKLRSNKTVFECKNCSHDKQFHVHYVVKGCVNAS